MTDFHRKKANKRRNGKTRYEKGRHLHDRHPPKKLAKGKRGSDLHNPEVEKTTLADVWPDD